MQAASRCHDRKGRRPKGPRRHFVPLTKEAAAILSARLGVIKDILERRSAIGDHSPVPFFSTDDKTSISRHTLGKLVSGISETMVKEGEARAPFQLRDIRRTAETLLAGLKVSKDVRSHLLSHGLGGVQNQHYDRHTYWTEKRQTLRKWVAYLIN
jgi:integrase